MKIFGIPLDLGGLVALIALVGGILISTYATNLTQAQQITSLTQDVGFLKEKWPYIERSLGRIEGKLGINLNADKSDWHH